MSIGFVRYHSPFGTPEWLLRAVAERRLIADLRAYERERDAGGLTKRQLEHGPPYIDDGAMPRRLTRSAGDDQHGIVDPHSGIHQQQEQDSQGRDHASIVRETQRSQTS